MRLLYDIILCNTVIPVLKDQEKIWFVKTGGLSQEVSYIYIDNK